MKLVILAITLSMLVATEALMGGDIAEFALMNSMMGGRGLFGGGGGLRMNPMVRAQAMAQATRAQTTGARPAAGNANMMMYPRMPRQSGGLFSNPMMFMLADGFGF